MEVICDFGRTYYIVDMYVYQKRCVLNNVTYLRCKNKLCTGSGRIKNGEFVVRILHNHPAVEEQEIERLKFIKAIRRRSQDVQNGKMCKTIVLEEARVYPKGASQVSVNNAGKRMINQRKKMSQPNSNACQLVQQLKIGEMEKKSVPEEKQLAESGSQLELKEVPSSRKTKALQAKSANQQVQIPTPKSINRIKIFANPTASQKKNVFCCSDLSFLAQASAADKIKLTKTPAKLKDICAKFIKNKKIRKSITDYKAIITPQYTLHTAEAKSQKLSIENNDLKEVEFISCDTDYFAPTSKINIAKCNLKKRKPKYKSRCTHRTSDNNDLRKDLEITQPMLHEPYLLTQQELFPPPPTQNVLIPQQPIYNYPPNVYEQHLHQQSYPYLNPLPQPCLPIMPSLPQLPINLHLTKHSHIKPVTNQTCLPSTQCATQVRSNLNENISPIYLENNMMTNTRCDIPIVRSSKVADQNTRISDENTMNNRLESHISTRPAIILEENVSLRNSDQIISNASSHASLFVNAYQKSNSIDTILRKEKPEYVIKDAFDGLTKKLSKGHTSTNYDTKKLHNVQMEAADSVLQEKEAIGVAVKNELLESSLALYSNEAPLSEMGEHFESDNCMLINDMNVDNKNNDCMPEVRHFKIIAKKGINGLEVTDGDKIDKSPKQEVENVQIKTEVIIEDEFEELGNTNNIILTKENEDEPFCDSLDYSEDKKFLLDISETHIQLDDIDAKHFEEAKCLLDMSETQIQPDNVHSTNLEYPTVNECALFGEYISKQLQQLPLDVALELQAGIQALVIKTRLEYIRNNPSEAPTMVKQEPSEIEEIGSEKTITYSATPSIDDSKIHSPRKRKRNSNPTTPNIEGFRQKRIKKPSIGSSQHKQTETKRYHNENNRTYCDVFAEHISAQLDKLPDELSLNLQSDIYTLIINSVKDGHLNCINSKFKHGDKFTNKISDVHVNI